MKVADTIQEVGRSAAPIWRTQRGDSELTVSLASASPTRDFMVRGMFLIQLSFADQEVVCACITAHPSLTSSKSLFGVELRTRKK
jgi:hypothetical protein